MQINTVRHLIHLHIDTYTMNNKLMKQSKVEYELSIINSETQQTRLKCGKPLLQDTSSITCAGRKNSAMFPTLQVATIICLKTYRRYLKTIKLILFYTVMFISCTIFYKMRHYVILHDIPLMPVQAIIPMREIASMMSDDLNLHMLILKLFLFHRDLDQTEHVQNPLLEKMLEVLEVKKKEQVLTWSQN